MLFDFFKILICALIGCWIGSALLVAPAVIRAIRSIRREMREEQESGEGFIIRLVTRPLK